MKHLTLLLLLSLTLVACDKDDTDPTYKNLFSYWIEDGTSGFLDLTPYSFGIPRDFNLWDTDGSLICTCEFTIFGYQEGGSWVINNCNNTCTGNSVSGDYAKPQNVLTWCYFDASLPGGEGCTTYR
jgi:hypothetical protein